MGQVLSLQLVRAGSGEKVTDRANILNIVASDAIVDLRDGYCMCYRCGKEYDLGESDETDEFGEHHILTAIINCIHLYKCYKKE